MAQQQGGGAINPTKVRRPPAVTAPPANNRGPNTNYGISGITAVPKSAPRKSGGSGGYSGGGGGGGGGYSSGRAGSNSIGSIAPVAPRPPSLSAFLSTDSAFMQQKSALEKAKQDYLAQQGTQKTQYLTGYTGDLDTIGRNRTEALGNLENDFASRGLLQSGLYADELGNTNSDFDKRTSALEQAKAAFLAGLASDQTNFLAEQGLTLNRAQQEAAARRAAQFGI